MKKIIHISILLVSTFSAFSLKAQNEALQRYWDDVDFSDTALVGSQMMSKKMVAFSILSPMAMNNALTAFRLRV